VMGANHQAGRLASPLLNVKISPVVPIFLSR